MNRERAFIYIALSIAVAIIILLFLARPAYQAMLESRDNLDKLEETEKERQQEIVDVKQVKSDFEGTPQEKIDDVNEHVPSHKNQAHLIAQLEAIGKDTRALLTSVQFTEPEEPVSGTSIYPLEVSVIVTGSYEQIRDYVASLEQNKRLFTLGNVVFNTSGSTLSGSIQFTTYHANLEKKVEAPQAVQTESVIE